ncbi:MAG: hypothetical protein RJA70_1022 [Pseudomonadota bacterium]|jgi:pyridoxal phosphate enzyme (YggS family)
MSEARLRQLAEALAVVEGRLTAACAKARRARDSVRLIAVSKRKPASDLRLAYQLGLRDFGENYAQELVEKRAQLVDLTELRLHMIGHLQRNKARHLLDPSLGAAVLIQTVDDTRLVSELDKRAVQAQLTHLAIFVAVNVAREPQKSGCLPEDLPSVLSAVASSGCLRLSGLMTIPPWSEDPEQSRVHFRALRGLRDQYCPEARRLSMGMSHDFEVAISEGATDVRVGTAIFGERVLDGHA